MTRCSGENCPLKTDCYRFTYPHSTRNFLAEIPYDTDKNECKHFVKNEPSSEFIQATAYYLWLSAGKPDGDDLKFWEEARKSCYESYGKND